MTDIAAGDWVRASWTTPNGKRKTVIGQVTELKQRKAALFLYIRYERTAGTRASFSWSVHDVWRPADQCEKLPPQAESDGAAFARAIVENARERAK